MKIKTIFKINIALIFLQGLPLFISWFSPEFKAMLLGDFFGSNPSNDAILMFDQFALVLAWWSLELLQQYMAHCLLMIWKY